MKLKQAETSKWFKTLKVKEISTLTSIKV